MVVSTSFYLTANIRKKCETCKFVVSYFSRKNAKKKPLVDFVKMMVEKSYGLRPKSNPSLFMKEDDEGHRLVHKFKASPAYDEFVYRLMTGEESLNDFMEKILPEIPEADVEAAKEKMKEEGFDFGEEKDASANIITEL